MSNSLKNFFCSDIYRAFSIIICFLNYLLVFPILIIVCGENRKFSSLFIIMLNLIIIGLITATTYNINWVIKDEETQEDILLFGGTNKEYFLCKLQAILINYTIMVRETLVSALMVNIYIMINSKINVSRNSRWFKYNFVISYGIPLIITLCELPSNAFGMGDEFCFVKNYLTDFSGKHKSQVIGSILYFYLIIIIIIDIVLTFSIIKSINRNDGDNDNEVRYYVSTSFSTSQKSCCDSYISKILIFSVLQIILHLFGIVYRLTDLFTGVNIEKLGGFAGITIMSPGFAYGLAFVITNKLCMELINFYKCKREHKALVERQTDDSFQDTSDRSINQLDVTN